MYIYIYILRPAHVPSHTHALYATHTTPYTSEFESHWVPLSYGLVPHLSKKLSKFPPTRHPHLQSHQNIPIKSQRFLTVFFQFSIHFILLTA